MEVQVVLQDGRAHAEEDAPLVGISQRSFLRPVAVFLVASLPSFHGTTKRFEFHAGLRVRHLSEETKVRHGVRGVERIVQPPPAVEAASAFAVAHDVQGVVARQRDERHVKLGVELPDMPPLMFSDDDVLNRRLCDRRVPHVASPIQNLLALLPLAGEPRSEGETP